MIVAPGIGRGDVTQGLSPRSGDLIVAARWPLLVARVRDGFPARGEHAGVFESAEDGVDGTAFQAGGVHDLEAVAKAAADSEEDDAGWIGDPRR
jgi:hypothetical protein